MLEAPRGPDAQRNVLYAVDIVLHVGRDNVGFFAVVEGSRSPKLPTGTRILNARFADLLVAMRPGAALQAVTDAPRSKRWRPTCR